MCFYADHMVVVVSYFSLTYLTVPEHSVPQEHTSPQLQPTASTNPSLQTPNPKLRHISATQSPIPKPSQPLQHKLPVQIPPSKQRIYTESSPIPTSIQESAPNMRLATLHIDINRVRIPVPTHVSWPCPTTLLRSSRHPGTGDRADFAAFV